MRDSRAGLRGWHWLALGAALAGWLLAGLAKAALAVLSVEAWDGGCFVAEPRAIWLHGRLDDSTVE